MAMPHAENCASSTTRSSSSRLGESRRELFNLRFQLATGQLDNIVRGSARSARTWPGC